MNNWKDYTIQLPVVKLKKYKPSFKSKLFDLLPFRLKIKLYGVLLGKAKYKNVV